jgi:hypothetical protein
MPDANIVHRPTATQTPQITKYPELADRTQTKENELIIVICALILLTEHALGIFWALWNNCVFFGGQEVHKVWRVEQHSTAHASPTKILTIFQSLKKNLKISYIIKTLKLSQLSHYFCKVVVLRSSNFKLRGEWCGRLKRWILLAVFGLASDPRWPPPQAGIPRHAPFSSQTRCPSQVAYLRQSFSPSHCFVPSATLAIADGLITTSFGACAPVRAQRLLSQPHNLQVRVWVPRRKHWAGTPFVGSTRQGSIKPWPYVVAARGSWVTLALSVSQICLAKGNSVYSYPMVWSWLLGALGLLTWLYTSVQSLSVVRKLTLVAPLRSSRVYSSRVCLEHVEPWLRSIPRTLLGAGKSLQHQSLEGSRISWQIASFVESCVIKSPPSNSSFAVFA